MNIFSQSKLALRMTKEGLAMFLSIVAAIILCTWFASQADANVAVITKQRTLKYELEAKNEIASKLVSDYRSVQFAQPLIEHAFLPENNVLEFVSTIDSIASKRSLVHSVHFGTPAPAGKNLGDDTTALTHIPFTITVQSNVYILNEFLKELEKLPYFIDVTSVNIAGQGATGWKDMANVTIQGTLFTRGEQKI